MPHAVSAELETLLVSVESLAPYAQNARRHDDSALVASLTELGQYRPIVVNRRDASILAGNGTYAAALALGWDQVAATFVDVDEQTARKIVLADNRTNDLASYDDAALLALLQELEDDFAGTGFDQSDVDSLLAHLGAAGYGDDALSDPESEQHSRYARERMIDCAFEHFRQGTIDELLAASLPPVAECMRQIEMLARADTDTLLNSTTAYHVADRWHAHRYDVPIPGKATVRATFDRDEHLRHALSMLIDGGTKISAGALVSQLAFTRGAQLAAQFRPAFALLMYRTFTMPGSRVLDTSTGFGGRLVGFLASSCSEYVGIDPSAVTCAGNRALLDALRVDSKRVELIEQPAEDVTIEQIGGAASCDFAFTSPPYFAKERYSDEPTQSCVRYDTGESWRDGFLAPMLALQFAALKPGAHALVNIADVKIGNVEYPLVKWTQQLAVAAGFVNVRLDQFPLGRVPGQGEAAERFEPIVVLRKPPAKGAS